MIDVKGTVHCGQCHPWAGNPELNKKAEQAMEGKSVWSTSLSSA